MRTDKQPSAVTDSSLEDMVASSETGARRPLGAPGKLLVGVAAAWSLFQLWIASPLPYMLRFGVFSATEARSIHLSFALFLAFMAYPALKRSPRQRIPLQDWVLAAIAVFCGAYLFLFYTELAQRPGRPITQDVVVGVVGIVMLLEATRRALGPPLMIVAGVFIVYSLFGSYMPGILAHRGVSLSGLVNHQWLGTQGVFGIALGVSTSFVFLFVLFGSLLDKAGAGNYFIKVAFSMLGHYRGGPAKAAVVGSVMTGVVSGSSIANVVTTGTFTIPMMKRVGFQAHKAGAIEVCASVNGQLLPPVMGAAAFLMVEYVGIPYVEVIRHALLPAVITYIALFYIIHLEAVKADMKGLPSSNPPRPFLRKMLGFMTGLVLLMALSFIVYYGLGWMRPVLGSAAPWVIGVMMLATYIGLLKIGSKYPELELDDPNAETVTLPRTKPTVMVGLHYILPVIVLVWCLMVERLSPGTAAFYATLFIIFIAVTQRPIIAYFRGRSQPVEDIKSGFRDLWDGLVAGARNMVGIGVATAAAGIVVGAVSQTGVGLVLADVVEILSGGSLILILIFTAVLCVLLGLGLPTTANYIVVSALMAPVIVTLGEQNGLIVPLIAVHMFVFYFGLMADSTPPVGLAAFAASAISGADPIRTGLSAFYLDLRTVALPFMFIFNTNLLLIDVTLLQGIMVFIVATIAMLIFAAATQGYMLTRCRWYEIVLLLLVAFTLFRPGFWMDRIHAPYDEVPPAEFAAALAQAQEGEDLRVQIAGEDAFGDPLTTFFLVPAPPGATPEERMENLGLELWEEDGQTYIDMVEFGSPAENIGFDFDQQILRVEVPADRPASEWLWIPAFLVFGGVAMLQRRRRDKGQAQQQAIS